MRRPLDTQTLRHRLKPINPQLVPEIRVYAGDSLSRLGTLARKPPYWAFPWPGGCLLARYLLDNPGEAAGRRVLDVGTGCGIAAIAAARCGASSVTAVDADPAAAAAAGVNAELNGVAVACGTLDALRTDVTGYDLLLVGDLFYDKRLAARMTRFLDRCSAGAAILVGDIGRVHLPLDRLRPLATYRVADFGSTRSQSGGVYRWIGGS